MELTSQTREKLGKKAKSLISERKIPAVVFGKGIDSIPISVDQLEFVKVFRNAGETTLVDLSVGGKNEKVLIKDVQLDPITGSPIHAAFHKVNLKEKIKAEIPVEVVGEAQNDLIKSGEGLVLTLLNSIAVEALPSDLPHEFVVDVSGIITLGGGVKVSDLVFDREKVEILDAEPDELVVKIDSARMAEEVVEEVTEAEALASVEATEELTPEEKAAREQALKEEEDKE